MTYEQLQMSGLESVESLPKKSRSFPQDSRASLTALQERVGAIVTSVTCGERLRECSEKFARAGLSVKIRPVYFQEKINGISDESFPTLPRWGITWGGEYGALVTWERRTSGSVCSLWRTPTASDGEFSGRTNANLAERWVNQKQKHLSEQVAYFEAQGGGTIRETFPTPTVADSKNVGFNGAHQFNLHKYVALYPTPQATSWGCSGARTKLRNLQEQGTITEEERRGMSAGNGGKLNPTWVEWLMGFPLGWTDLEGSETR